MEDKEESVTRKRMVVEEVGVSEAPKPEILDEAAKVSSSSLTDTMPVPPPSKKSPFVALWIIIPGIFLLGAILGGVVFYQKGVNRGQVEIASPTATPIVLSTPTASPAASIDLTKYTVTIFNGSGISGEAGKAKTLLTTAGFKVGSTANAATYNYTKTIIKAKSTVEATFLSALSTALEKSYLVDSPQTLATSSADTVQVVIGSSKAQ